MTLHHRTVLSTHCTPAIIHPSSSFLIVVSFWLRFCNAVRWRRHGDNLRRVVAPHSTVIPIGDTQPSRTSSIRGIVCAIAGCIALLRASSVMRVLAIPYEKVLKRLNVGKNQTSRRLGRNVTSMGPEVLMLVSQPSLRSSFVRYFIFLFLYVHGLTIMYISKSEGVPVDPHFIFSL
jgi:hypothetical protein